MDAEGREAHSATPSWGRLPAREQNQVSDRGRRREPTQQERTRALFYAQEWLIPLLQIEEGERSARVRALAEQEWDIPESCRCGVSESTLWRLLKCYRQEGLEGLFRKPRLDAGRARVLPAHILERAIEIRKDLPSRSVRRIMTVLKREYPLEIDQVKSSTLSRALSAAGYPRVRRRRSEPKAGPQKERHIKMRWERPLQLVQSDVCGQTLWVKEDGQVRKASLIAVLDHCSKLSLYGAWVVAANLPALEKCVVGVLLAFGLFERLHVDHGAIYTSYLLKNICAELVINLKLTKKGYAAGKGGIERYFLTVEEDFCQEIGDSTRFTLAELNQRYRAWEHEYNRTVHSETGETPLERFQRLASEPRWPDPVKLRQASLLREPRIVDKRFCTVSVRSKEFAVDPSLRARRVQVRYDPFSLDEVLIYDAAGTRMLQRALPQPVNDAPAPFLPSPPAHPTPKIDVLSQLMEAKAGDDDASLQRRPRPASPKRPAFATFCAQVGRLLMRESTLSSHDLELLRECWERFGPFLPDFVDRTLEPLVGHIGSELHISEYLNALVAAHLSRDKE